MPVTPLPRKPKRKSSVKPILLAAGGTLVVVALALFWTKHSAAKRQDDIFRRLLAEANSPGTTSLRATPAQLNLLLERLSTAPADRAAIVRALTIARSDGAEDAAVVIARHVTGGLASPDATAILLREVLVKRNNPAVVAPLLQFAANSKDSRSVAAAVQACREMATDDHLQDLVALIRTGDSATGKAAEEVAAAVISKLPSKSSATSPLAEAWTSEKSSVARQSLVRLLGRCGGEKAAKAVESSLASRDSGDQKAAIQALGFWPDLKSMAPLIRAAGRLKDESLKPSAFQAALRSLIAAGNQTDPVVEAELWKSLANLAKSDAEMIALIKHLGAGDPKPWEASIVDYFRKNAGTDDVTEAAEVALSGMKDNFRTGAR